MEIGDRVKYITTNNPFTNLDGYVDCNYGPSYKPIRVRFDSGDYLWCSRQELKIINENNMIHPTKEKVLEAHRQGCSTAKKVIEALYPEVFEKKKIKWEMNKIYAFANFDYYIWVLHKIDGKFRWISICGLNCSAKETFEDACDEENFWERGKIFDNKKDFIKWCSEQLNG